MKAIVSVIGKDQVGIIAKVSNLLSGLKINVEDISQTLMQEYFVMIMMVDLSLSDVPLKEVGESLAKLGSEIGVTIRVQHEDIFNSMHKI